MLGNEVQTPKKSWICCGVLGFQAMIGDEMQTPKHPYIRGWAICRTSCISTLCFHDMT